MASIRKLTESAFKSLLDDLSLSATVFAGVSVDTKEAPAVVVRLASATEEPYKSGNYVCTVEIAIKSIAEDETAHDTLCEAVRNAIWADDLATQLQTAETGLRVFGCSAPHAIEYDVADDCWIETHTVEILAAAHEFPG